MSYTEATYKENYNRPASAAGFMSYGRVKLGNTEGKNKRVVAKTPASTVIGPAKWANYAEVATSKNAKPSVICSGYPIVFGGSTAVKGDKVGIATKDFVAGERIALDVEGLFYMQFDYLGDAGASPERVAGSKTTDLSGQPAYWMPTLGLVTNQAPAGGGQVYLEIGYFQGTPEAKPNGIDAGIYWAKVHLTNHVNQAEITLTSTSPATASNLIDAFASVEFETGDTLTVDIVTDAFFNNPNYAVKDSEISWVIDTGGTPVTLTGRRINYTGTAGTKACTLDITSNGVTMTQKTFNLVLHATNAPTLTAT